MLSKHAIVFVLTSTLLILSSNALADFKPIPEEELKTTKEMRTDLFRAAYYLKVSLP